MPDSGDEESVDSSSSSHSSVGELHSKHSAMIKLQFCVELQGTILALRMHWAII